VISRLGKMCKMATILVVVALVSGASSVMPAVTMENVVVAPTLAEPNVVVAPTRAEPVEEKLAAVAEHTEEEQGILPSRAPHTGDSQNLFSSHSWYTPPPAPPVRKAPPPMRREPTAPALPYKLLGTYEQRGSDILYFLVKDDRVYDVTIGDTLDGTYSVDGVTNGQLMFTYLPLNTSQGLRLGEE
jgi:hypothetical protein